MALILTALAGFPAGAQDAAPPPVNIVVAPPPTAKKLPFVPAGRVLTYRITRVPSGPGAPPSATMEQQLRFETRPEGGYLLTITTMEVEQNGKTYLPDSPVHELAYPPDAVALLAPLRLVLDNKGAIQRVDRFEDYRSVLRQVPNLATEAAKTEDQRRAAAAMHDDFLARMSSISPEQAAQPAAGIWAKIFGYGDMQYDAGRAREWTNRRELAGGKASVTYHTSLSVSPIPGGGYVIERNRREDPDQVAEASDALWSTGTPQALTEVRFLRANPQWLMDVTRIENAKVFLDERGIPSDVTIDEHSERADDKGGNTVTTVQLMSDGLAG